MVFSTNNCVEFVELLLNKYRCCEVLMLPLREFPEFLEFPGKDRGLEKDRLVVVAVLLVVVVDAVVVLVKCLSHSYIHR